MSALCTGSNASASDLLNTIGGSQGHPPHKGEMWGTDHEDSSILDTQEIMYVNLCLCFGLYVWESTQSIAFNFCKTCMT